MTGAGIKFHRLTVWIPIIVLITLTLVSGLVLFLVSLSQSAVNVPPYAPLIAWTDWESILLGLASLNFDNYTSLAERHGLAAQFFASLKIAAGAVVTCLAAGFPIAMAIARASERLRRIAVLLLVLLTFTAMVVRTYGLLEIIHLNGLPAISSAEFTIYLGAVHAYLPLMILPLFFSMRRQDPLLIEAAVDLGCSRTKAFWTITLPLCLPGVMTGCLLVFIPVMGEIVIPDLLGGTEQRLMGQAIWSDFFRLHDWPLAAATTAVLLLALLAPVAVLARVRERQWDTAR